MYKITTKDGEEHLTEWATWIRVHPSGRAYLLCERNRAEGVAYQGRPYLYKDGNSVAEIDVGADIQRGERAMEDNDAMSVDQEYRLTLLELGLNE